MALIPSRRKEIDRSSEMKAVETVNPMIRSGGLIALLYCRT